jgi:hypothetical protein
MRAESEPWVTFAGGPPFGKELVMSKKVLILAVAVALIGGAVAIYAWFDYRGARDSLHVAEQAVHSFAENLDRHDVNLHEMYRVADVSVYQLEYSSSMWIGKEEIAALRTTLKEAKHELDQREAAANKQKPSPDYGGWVRPSSQ